MAEESNNIRIAKNTGLLYIRSLVCLLLSLFSSRYILQALGVVDYGIYNAVGGFVSMFWMISAAISSSVGRFLNVEMGKNNRAGINEVFSVSIISLLFLSFITLLLVESAGYWFLTHKMTITPARMTAAIWVFHLSVLTIVSGFVFIPFDASILAHERFDIYAYINIGEAVFKLCIAVYLVWGECRYDKLVVYAILMAMCTMIIRLFVLVFARKSYEECRMRVKMNWNRLREMVNYAWWNLFGTITATFNGQGINVAFNISHGPVLNAARGLANTVSNTVSLFVYNMTLSFRPQITQSFSAGNQERVKDLVYRGTRFSAYLMLLFILPLVLEMPECLSIWLGTYPEYTVAFSRMSLITCYIGLFDGQFVTAIQSKGDIKAYQICTTLLTAINFPLALWILKTGGSPVWVYSIMTILVAVRCIVTIAFIYKQFRYSVKDIFEQVFLKIFMVILLSSIVPLVFHELLGESFFRLIVVTLLSTICVTVFSFLCGFTADDRKAVSHYTKKFFNKGVENHEI